MAVDVEPLGDLAAGPGVGYFATGVGKIATLAAPDLTERPIYAAHSELLAILCGMVFARDFEHSLADASQKAPHFADKCCAYELR